MKLFMPKQHGAWAMLIVPFWLGVAASHFKWQHIPFFLGWVLLYLATYPMLLLFKKKKLPFYAKWSLLYMVPALAFLMFPLVGRPAIVYFGVSMLPFFLINAYYSSINKDRAFPNDVSAIFAFSIPALASSFLADGTISMNAVLVFLSSIMFFMGSTFYVKTLIREKKNPFFKNISWFYHLATPIIWMVAGFPIAALAFIPSLVRAIGFYGRNLSPLKIGVFEIVNAALFFALIVIQLIH